MKKQLAITLALGIAGSAAAAYVSPVWESTSSPWGSLSDAAKWPGGVFPSGSSTGLVSSVTKNAWVGSGYLQDIAIRDESGIQIKFIGATALRGGSLGSGITTVYEIDDPDGDYSTTNLYADTEITLWSQKGEKMELSILSGHVETPLLKLVSNGNGTINMRDGLLHVGSCITANAQFNMLAGGTGNITVDSVENNVFNVNFETGNAGSFTLGSKNGGTAGGVWGYAINNGFISIDGVTTTDASQFSITSSGGNDTTLSVIPEPATFGLMALVGGGILFIRKRFMI